MAGAKGRSGGRRAGAGRPRLKTNVGGGYSDPREFLRAVMNDPGTARTLRVRAAKALLRGGRVIRNHESQ